MEPRLDAMKVAPEAINAMVNVPRYLEGGSAIEPKLRFLVETRASQINGCAFCLDMHIHDIRKAGESQQRLDVLAAWRETDFFNEREQAALAWAEAVTNIATHHISEEDWKRVRKAFSDKELVDLTVIISMINAWNRMSVAFRKGPARR